MKKELQSAFVTRQFMLEPDYEIYYYNDPLLDSVSTHQHDCYEFYFFLSGNAQLTIGDHSYNVKKGNMAVIPPGVKHKLQILDHKSPYQRFILWISKDFASNIMHFYPSTKLVFESALGKDGSSCHLDFFDLFEFSSLQSQLLNIIEETHIDQYGKDEKIFNQIVGLMLDLSRKIHNMSADIKDPVKPLFVNVIEYVDRHLSEDLSLDAIADHFFVSKYHLSHVFKDNMGISLYQYILKKRLKSISSAILSDKEITDVYADYGFKDYSSFYRAFKNEYGVSPKQYKSDFQKRTRQQAQF